MGVSLICVGASFALNAPQKGFDYLEWVKVSINTASVGIEIITGLLIDMGIAGVEIHDPSEMEAFFSAADSSAWDYIDDSLFKPGQACAKSDGASVIFYLGTDTESYELLTRIKHKVENIQEPIGPLRITTETVDDQLWLHEWKKHFRPFRIGRVLIVPEWEALSYKRDDIVFTIDPGSAFGTGQHATTMLCIEALQKHIKAGNKVLDIGCGSGILSIIGLLLGAKQSVACDIDPAAVEITKRNAVLNPVDPHHLEVHTGNILSDPGLQNKIFQQKYDVIVANIVADVIIGLAPLIPSLLASDGVFIASGIICERLEDVKSALTATGLSIIGNKHSEGWHCVVANG